MDNSHSKRIQASILLSKNRPAAAKEALEAATVHNFNVKSWPSFHIMQGYVLLAQAEVCTHPLRPEQYEAGVQYSLRVLDVCRFIFGSCRLKQESVSPFTCLQPGEMWYRFHIIKRSVKSCWTWHAAHFLLLVSYLESAHL